MSGITIAAGTTTLGTATQPGRSAGSAAERALKEATKALAEAQQKLLEDVAQGAGKEIIESDKMAVQAAAAAVAQAAAGLAKEQQQAEDAKLRARQDRTGAQGPMTDAAALAALISATNSLDVYA